MDNKGRQGNLAQVLGDSTMYGSQEDYREIDQNFLDNLLERPFMNQTLKDLNDRRQLYTTLPLYIEWMCFYKRFDDLSGGFPDLRELHGSGRPWPNHAVTECAQRFVFDKSPCGENSIENLQQFLAPLIQQPHHLVFVHFIKENAPSHKAHQELINCVAYYIRRDFPRLQVKIVEVIIENAKGDALYTDPYWKYFKTNKLAGGTVSSADPWPFVMVRGTPMEPIGRYGGWYKLHKEDYRFDFDLFQNCREAESTKDRNSFFARNLRKALHGLWRFAGIITDETIPEIKDFREWDEEKVSHTVRDLSHHALVLKLHTQKYEPLRCAEEAVKYLRLIGCPYVVLALADGDPDMAQISFDDAGVESFTELRGVKNWKQGYAEELGENLRKIYGDHKLNGAKSKRIDPKTFQKFLPDNIVRFPQS